MAHLFNLSLKTGYFPESFKTAKIILIYKSDDKHNFTNYHPISLLTSLSKLLEKIVAKQLNGYLYKYKILYKNQYGFRSNHSTTHPMVQLLDKLFNCLSGDIPDFGLSIFLDLKNAVDTVDHTILL